FDYFKNKPFCTITGRKSFPEYLKDLSSSKFVLSPEGAGLDCHRVWESLLMGAIPIVKHSILDSLYSNLPIVIVKDWNEITEEFLDKTYKKITASSYNFNKVYIQYWIDEIKGFQKKIRESKK